MSAASPPEGTEPGSLHWLYRADVPAAEARAWRFATWTAEGFWSWAGGFSPPKHMPQWRYAGPATPPPIPGAKPNCAELPMRAEREAACREPYHWDDGVPYCDTCGLFRSTIAKATPPEVPR